MYMYMYMYVCMYLYTFTVKPYINGQSRDRFKLSANVRCPLM